MELEKAPFHLVQRKAVDREPADGHVDRLDNETVAARSRPGDLDHEDRVEPLTHRVRVGRRAGLGVAVDRHGLGDRGKRRRRRDGVRPRADDVEGDRVGARIGVGVQDRLAEGPGPGVGRRGHRVGDRGKSAGGCKQGTGKSESLEHWGLLPLHSTKGPTGGQEKGGGLRPPRRNHEKEMPLGQIERVVEERRHLSPRHVVEGTVVSCRRSLPSPPRPRAARSRRRTGTGMRRRRSPRRRAGARRSLRARPST